MTAERAGPEGGTVMGLSVGIGLTNECNLRCPHCYRPDAVIDRLSLEDVRRVCASIPVRSVNLGAVRTSRLPIPLTRRANASPQIASRSRSRNLGAASSGNASMICWVVQTAVG